jgi:outer membrane murein-binding lipoprotein Lpp
VNKERTEMQGQVVTLQNQLAEAEKLRTDYDRLSNDYSAMRNELETLQAKYDELDAKHLELGAKYDELSEQYNVLVEEEIITEEDIEQAIFELINQERQNNGIDELEWDRTLHRWAKSHSRDMATRKILEYSEDSAWQDVWQAAGYSTVDGLASAALMIWKDSKRYEGQFLAKGAKLGAVAAYKSGEVFYITYFAHLDF